MPAAGWQTARRSRAGDPLLAAHHFIGLLLWIPINRAMFTGNHDSGKADLESYADQAVSTFLRAYRAPQSAEKQVRRARPAASDARH